MKSLAELLRSCIRWSRAVSRFLAALLGFLIFSTGVSVMIFLRWPELIVNSQIGERFARYAVERWLQPEFEMDWRALEVQVDQATSSLLRKSIWVRVSDFCVKLPSERFSGCGEKVGFRISVDFSGISWAGESLFDLLPRVTGMGPLSLKGFKWDLENQEGPRLRGKLDFNGGSAADEELYPIHLKLRASVFGARNRSIQNFGAYGIQSLDLQNCQLVLTRFPASEMQRPDSFRIDCPVKVSLSEGPKGNIKKTALMDLPKTVKLELQADLALSSGSRIFGPIQVRIPGVQTSGVWAGAQFRTLLDGGMTEPLDRWKAETDFSVQLKVPEFQSWVRHLEQVSLANWEESWESTGMQFSVIPAPLHVLHGNLNLNLSGSASLNSGETQLHFKSQLKSLGQKLDLEGKGKLGFGVKSQGTALFLKLDLAFRNVRLELPRLSLGPPPRIFPDQRLVRSAGPRKTEKREPGEFQFEYEIRFHTLDTPPGKPILISSNLASSPIPVRFNLRLSSSDPVQGSVQVGQFPFQVFRRDAILDQVRIQLKSPAGQSGIQGNVLVGYADYQVIIQLIGTLEKPQIVFLSEPPLPENQIVAVLLFGRPLDELDLDQSLSVTNTKAALADGAISLASLYLLASTPIQSVSYDPSTRVISAKVRLGEGASLNLGKGDQKSTIGIRKRIGKYWTLETDYSSAPILGNVGTAYLEWSHRY